MLLIDARCLHEPHPTGVTEVARQCIAELTALVPHAHVFTARESFSNTITNVRLATRTTTVEDLCNVPRNAHDVTVFLPNIHFLHTRPHTRRIQLVHDLSFFYSPQWYGPRMRAWHACTRARAQLTSADTLIAVSDWTARGLIDHLHVDPARVHVITPHTPPSIAPERPNLPIRDEPFFLFVGTIEKRKNVRGVIEAFALLQSDGAYKNFHLIIAGQNGFGAPHAHDVPPHVHILPYVTPAHKWWLFAHACALVYPSFFEGFGLPPLEAASVGCPLIISDCTAPPETMGNAALTVSPYDIKQIALAMRTLATDDHLRAEMITRGRERAAWYSTSRQHAAFATVCRTYNLL